MRIYFAALIFLILPAASARAVDPGKPAVLDITVTDQQGNPIPDASVNLIFSGGGESRASKLTVRTDGQGKAEITRPVPSEIVWDEQLTVEKDGDLTFKTRVTLFPAAQIRQTIALKPKRTTIIRVLDSAGHPVEGVPIYLFYHDDYDRGDIAFLGPNAAEKKATERGEFLWEHETVPKGGMMEVGPRVFSAQDVPLMAVSLTQDELDHVGATRTVEGTLLLDDGKPARGWYVADQGYGGMTISDGGIMIVFYNARGLVPVSPEGRFSVSAMQKLFVISPQGVPIFYDINPNAWEAGPHHITLTLPPLPLTVRGRLLDGGGKPLAGLSVSMSGGWERGAGWDFDLSNMRTADGKTVGALTDQEGNYAIPVREDFSGTARVHWNGEHDLRNAGVSGAVVAEALSPQAPSMPPFPGDFVDVTLEIRDPGGNLVPKAEATCSGDRPGSLDFLRSAAAADSRGLHFFVRRNATVHVNMSALGWELPPATFTVGDSDLHQVITCTPEQRLQPLKGRLLGPDGKPVEGAIIAIRPSEENGGQWFWGGFPPTAQSDAEGRFEFPFAPKECYLNPYRFDSTGDVHNLPGWTEPVRVSPSERDVEIHLRPGALVKILLPPAFNRPLNTVVTTMQGVSDNDFNKYVNFGYDAKNHTLTAPSIRPGTLLFSNDSMRQLAYIADEKIQVADGKDVIVDWRDRPVPALEQAGERWTSVQVLEGGKPVSGEQVRVYADICPPDVIRAWIDQWKTGDEAVRARSEAALMNAGAPAREILESVRNDSDVAPLAKKILAKPSDFWPADGAEEVASDLSDDQGDIRFRSQLGREYVAVAGVHGKYLGWQKFILPPQGDQTVSLKPVRQLRFDFDFPQLANPNSGPEVFPLFTEPGEFEARALTRFLAGDGSLNMRRHFGSAALTISDMPVGSTLKITSRDVQSKSVTIQAGQDFQAIK